MPVDLLQLPVYEITCSACKKESLHSLLDVIIHNQLPCPLCSNTINVAEHYCRPEIEELLKYTGHGPDFFGVNDKL